MKSFNVPPSSLDKDINNLVKYTQDVKPYHTKLIEITEETVLAEKARIRIIENLKIQES